LGGGDSSSDDSEGIAGFLAYFFFLGGGDSSSDDSEGVGGFLAYF